jgi:hypothetical protein
MANERSGMSLCGKAAVTIVVGVTLFALLANARDIGKYLKLKAMSIGSVKP